MRFAIHYDWDLVTPSCTWHRATSKDDGVTLRGEHRLVEERGGTRYEMSWELTVKMPVVGKLFEKKVEGGILDGVRKRERFARDWLDRGED